MHAPSFHDYFCFWVVLLHICYFFIFFILHWPAWSDYNMLYWSLCGIILYDIHLRLPSNSSLSWWLIKTFCKWLCHCSWWQSTGWAPNICKDWGCFRFVLGNPFAIMTIHIVLHVLVTYINWCPTGFVSSGFIVVSYIYVATVYHTPSHLGIVQVGKASQELLYVSVHPCIPAGRGVGHCVWHLL